MPTVLVLDGFRFFFYSLEGQEPPHIHVEHGDNVAEFWLSPVQLAESHGFRSHDLNRLRIKIMEHQTRFLEAWDDHFSH